MTKTEKIRTLVEALELAMKWQYLPPETKKIGIMALNKTKGKL